ncbi:unnamed protein product [Lactuca virosa]|uniref:Uncharacterized protein n=1 Tax=Lactuca virosa TaxID=75947 RepID=A0AAU9PCJ2_9ASTR|nr:unnamed protein product [Lactuca virosa]
MSRERLRYLEAMVITPAYLWQSQVQHAPLPMDVGEYQMPLLHVIEIRLKAKCDKLADAFIDDLDSSTGRCCSKDINALLILFRSEFWSIFSCLRLIHRKIMKYLVEAIEEASLAYNKVVTRLREYQPPF